MVFGWGRSAGPQERAVIADATATEPSFGGIATLAGSAGADDVNWAPLPAEAPADRRRKEPLPYELKSHNVKAHLQDRSTAVVDVRTVVDAPHDVIFDLLADPHQHERIFDAIESASAVLVSEEGAVRRWRLDYRAKWRFWKVGGVCDNRLWMTTDRERGTVSFVLREPGFLRKYEGTWTITGPHGSGPGVGTGGAASGGRAGGAGNGGSHQRQALLHDSPPASPTATAAAAQPPFFATQLPSSVTTSSATAATGVAANKDKDKDGGRKSGSNNLVADVADAASPLSYSISVSEADDAVTPRSGSAASSRSSSSSGGSSSLTRSSSGSFSSTHTGVSGGGGTGLNLPSLVRSRSGGIGCGSSSGGGFGGSLASLIAAINNPFMTPAPAKQQQQPQQQHHHQQPVNGSSNAASSVPLAAETPAPLLLPRAPTTIKIRKAISPKVSPPFPINQVLKGHACGQVNDMLEGLLLATARKVAEEGGQEQQQQ